MTETDAYILGFFAYWDDVTKNPFSAYQNRNLYDAWNDGEIAAYLADFNTECVA